MSGARKCHVCGRMQYNVDRVSLCVNGVVRVELDLCRSCLSDAIDDFVRIKAVAP